MLHLPKCVLKFSLRLTVTNPDEGTWRAVIRFYLEVKPELGVKLNLTKSKNCYNPKGESNV
jgi:hypothetical protein